MNYVYFYTMYKMCVLQKKKERMEIFKIFFFISLYFILQFMIAVKGNSKIYYDKRFIIRRTGQNRF